MPDVPGKVIWPQIIGSDQNTNERNEEMGETVQEWAARIEREDQELAKANGYDKLTFKGPRVPDAFRKAFGGKADSNSGDHDGSDDSSSANWDGGGWW